jgi:fibronectin-binding autotransporter adhesin
MRFVQMAFVSVLSAPVLADTIYWDGTTNSLWTSTAAWSTSGSAATPNPVAPPGATDDVWFNVSGSNAANNVYLNGNQAANSFTFRSTGATTLLSGTTTTSGVQALLIGGGGITVNSGAGAVAIGNLANPIAFALTTSQTWVNSSTNSLFAYGSYVGSAASGTQSFTIGGSGNTTISGSIGNGVAGGALSLVKTGAGTLTLTSGTIGSGTSGFTGGVWIQSGRLQLATTASGSAPAVASFDPLLGAVPLVVDPTNIRIGSRATLGLDASFNSAAGGRTISANRGIAISGTAEMQFNGDMRNGRSFVYAGIIGEESVGSTLTLSASSTTMTGNFTPLFSGTFSGNNTFTGQLRVSAFSTNPYTERWMAVLSGSNAFAGGIVIDAYGAFPILRAETAGALGKNLAGNSVAVNYGELSIATAASLGSNQTVSINGASGSFNVLDLGYNGPVPTNVEWSAASGGVLGLGANFTTALDMGVLGSAEEGNLGRLYLGSGQASNRTARTYSAATLGVGADGLYRLGGGGNNTTMPVLVLSNAVLTGATNGVIVGRNGWVNGAAEVRLNAANSYGGSTTIDQGMLTLTTASASILNSSGITINTGGTLRLDNTAAANNTNRVGDATPISINGGTLNFSNNAGAANYSESIGGLTLGKGLASLTTSAAATGSSSTLTFASLTRNAGSALQVNGTSVGADARNRIVFTDPSGIKNQSGAAVANGAIIPWAVNGYSGTVTGFLTHTSGTLQPYTFTAAETKTGTSGWTNDSGAAFASTANVRWVISGSATMAVPSGTTTINSLSFYASTSNNGDITLGAADRLVISSGAVYSTAGGNVGLNLGTVVNQGSITAAPGTTEMIVSFTGRPRLNAVLVDPDANTKMALTLTGSGNNMFTFAGTANTYSGDTIIANGALVRIADAGATAAIPSGPGKGDLYVYGTFGNTGDGFNGGGNVNGLWGNGTIASISSTRGLIVGNNNATSQFDGVFASGGFNNSLSKVGSGTLTLTGMSTVQNGSFRIDEGVLAVASVRDGGYASALGAYSAASSLILSSLSTNGTLRYVGQDPNSTDRLFTIGGSVAGVTGTIDASGRTPNASSGIDSRATVSFTGTGAIAYGTVNQARTVAFAGTNTGTNTFAPQLNNNGTGVVSVVKNGVGRWRLSGSNAFTGGLTVTAGTLLVGSPTALGTGGSAVTGGMLDLGGFSVANAVTLSGSGVLAGTGSVGSLVVNSGGILSPGNSPGTIAAANVTWNGGGAYLWEINDALGAAGLDPGWDLLSATGSLSIGATSENPFTIQLVSLTATNEPGQAVNWAPDADGRWLVAEFGSPITGFSAELFSLDDSAFVGMGVGRSFSLVLGTSVAGGTDSQLYVVYAVPEPAAVMLAGIGMAIAAWAAANRSRRRSS